MYCATCICRQLSMQTCKKIRLLTFRYSGNDSYKTHGSLISRAFFEIAPLAVARRLSLARRFNAGDEANSPPQSRQRRLNGAANKAATVGAERSTVAAATMVFCRTVPGVDGL